MDPGAKIETFQVETAARRALKELVETYVDVQKEQNRKLKELGGSVDSSRRRIEAVEQLLKRIQNTMSAGIL